MENCKPLTECVCCGSENLRLILDLGDQSPANNYNVTEKFPLKLNACTHCSHAQISHVVNPDILFKDYPYMSGISETMKDYYKLFAESVCSAFPGAKTVFEIACNDGAQLDEFSKLGLETDGVDPAMNLAKTHSHNVLVGCFPEATHEDRVFDIIVAQNVFAHVEDPFSFLLGCKKIMHSGSVLIIQTSQAKMLQNHQADTIYHEHVSFFNKRSISRLFSRADFEIVDYQFLSSIHGGSDLYTLKKLPEITPQDYSEFAGQCNKFSANFYETVANAQKSGQLVICYGAAAKMINLLRFTGIKPDYIIDDTPTKIGKMIEGCMVKSGEFLEASDLEGALIIPVWNFYQEIRNKVEAVCPDKFQFLKYTPKIEFE